MPPRLSWSHLVPGLIALTVLVVVAIGVLTFAGVGRVKGETIRIHVLTDQARGLMKGSEVWLDGQKVGLVDHVGFRAPTADTLHRVVIAADIREDAGARLRHDSRIQVRPGGTVIGPVVVFLESGTPRGRAIRAGDTLRALAQSDAETVVERAGVVTTDLPLLIADAKTVMQHARNPDGTIGAFLAQGMPSELAELKRNVAALRARDDGEPPAPTTPALRRRAAAVMAQVDSIRALLASPHTSLGRFRRDSSLLRAVAEIRADLDTLERRMAESPGTVSRLRGDSALAWSVTDARREMALLFDDMKRRPLRYIHF